VVGVIMAKRMERESVLKGDLTVQHQNLRVRKILKLGAFWNVRFASVMAILYATPMGKRVRNVKT